MNCPNCNLPITGPSLPVDGEPFHLSCAESLLREIKEVPQQEVLGLDDLLEMSHV